MEFNSHPYPPVMIRFEEGGVQRFAAAELQRYLLGLDVTDVRLQPLEGEETPEQLAASIVLATAEHPALESRARLAAVADPRLDDSYAIEVKDLRGCIAGSNPRSVLLGMYRFLHELGIWWVRPGEAGTCYPQNPDLRREVSISEAAEHRHRGICIEGAVPYETLRDIIDWAPKLGFNAYFIQLTEGYTFFERWYSHADNPYKHRRSFPLEGVAVLTEAAVREIEKRGLLYHAVGHGWTCMPLGIPALGWDYGTPEIGDPEKQYLALVNGKRELFGGVPLNTNLCYSNPEVQRLVCHSIAAYLERHPEVEYLHFWLADGQNNQCECEGCRGTRPADFYVQMLNALDALLTSRGIGTRVVFLLYVDLLWPPERERLRNPDRFVMMFAPITRSYSHAFPAAAPEQRTPEYHRNRLVFPREAGGNLLFLRDWQRLFTGDSFAFEYHLCWEYHRDSAGMQIARILHQDIRNLKALGLNGYVSCQTTRAFFPTGLAMTVMGKTLWNARQEYEPLAREYFRASFGAEGEQARRLLEELSEALDPPFFRGERKGQEAVTAAKAASVPRIAARYAQLIASNRKAGQRVQAGSWAYLEHYLDVALGLAEAMVAKASGKDASAAALWKRLTELVMSREELLKGVWDNNQFVSFLKVQFPDP
jgi:hypothetical protein